MNAKILLTSSAAPGLVLESIDSSHLELLRTWKNANRERFFHQEAITPQEQVAWFAGYLARPDDCMFVVKAGGHAIGCAGARREMTGADIYNIIHGDREGPPAAMRAAAKIVGTFGGMRFGYPVGGKVLAANYAAARWQRMCGASVACEGECNGIRYYRIDFPPESAVPVEIHTADEPAENTAGGKS
jgi:hypothetical protein